MADLEDLRTNDAIADRLDEVARIYDQQGANRFRVAAWRAAGDTLRGLDRPVAALYDEGGLEALQALPDVGETIGRTIAMVLEYGRLPMLDRLRGESEPVAVLRTVPGIGETFARRLHRDLGIETLEELEAAAHDGRLEAVDGIGGKRLEGIRDSLARRLSRVRSRPLRPRGPAPPVAELLDVDREYRRKATRDELERIAPRRFNPAGETWLPILHTSRGERHYTALFSNTARAHQLGKTRDWVVLHADDGARERQATVLTSTRGPLEGRRIVAGREAECLEHYRRVEAREVDEARDRAETERSAERARAARAREPL
ncbi:MAG: helix-hairpin-helix domain-containing protein [Gemmatimonadota bacterium]|nr:helix-hairpin-helix domain-containing protein [Gemmatimonadota bacterium]